MKSVIKALKEGDAKERLAVIADIATLAGVSLATFSGGILALASSTENLSFRTAVGSGVIAFIGLAVVLLITVLFIWVISFATKESIKLTDESDPSKSKLISILTAGFCWCMYIAFQLIAIYYCYYKITLLIHSE